MGGHTPPLTYVLAISTATLVCTIVEATLILLYISIMDDTE